MSRFGTRVHRKVAEHMGRATRVQRTALIHMLAHGGISRDAEDDMTMIALKRRGFVEHGALNDTSYAVWYLTPAGRAVAEDLERADAEG